MARLLSRRADAARPPRATRLVAAVRTDPAALATACATVIAVAYLFTVPHVPDLAAQVARADAARRTGGSLWWGGWYGGVATPPYSLITGPVMGFLGVATVGAAAFVSSAWLAGALMRRAHRPRAGALAATAALGADLLAGRVTFAVGLVAALGSALLLQRRRGRSAALVGAMSGLLSPLAAFFLALAALSVVFVDRPRRWAGAMVGVAALGPVLAVSLLFPQTSKMPVSGRSLWVPAVTLGVLACLRLPRVVRAMAALSAVSIFAAFVLPTPLGSNAQRLALVAAAPAAVALAKLPRRWLVALLVGLLPWPMVDVATSFAQATDPSAQSAYYSDLLAMLPTGAAPGRLEVVEPKSQWAAAYIAAKVPLARGWERQIDAAQNPLFYGGAPLNATTYRDWLDTNAVDWVALPDAPLDFGATAEGKLVAAGLPYLKLAWSTDHWKWYVVEHPAPVADTPVAATSSLVGNTVVVDVAHPGKTLVRVHWTPQLGLDGAAGCLSPAAVTPGAPAGSAWVELTAVLPGQYVIHSGFSPLNPRRTESCTPGWQAAVTPGWQAAVTPSTAAD